MIIRPEQEDDFNKVYELIKKAFSASEHSDGTEQDLVRALRKSTAFIPELSLVALIDSNITGHIIFTRIKVSDTIGLALAPLSVLPEYQRQGIGSSLVKEGHKIAKKLGYNFSIVLGSKDYYSRFGYCCAKNFGIEAPFDVMDENFMVFNLSENYKIPEGKVVYPKEFGI